MAQRRFQVTFEPSGRVIEVDEGSTILDAAQFLDIALDHVCGGACACATCHVIVKHGFAHLNERSDDEIDMLSTATGQTPSSRLACQTEVMTDIVVEIPR
jgi:2Fe-2S ferredoxin